MSEMKRDYVGYGGNPPRVEWPNGARVALNIVLNYEEGAELGALEADAKREMWGEVAWAVKPEDRDLVIEAMYEYGSREGVWRIMRILDKYDMTCTVNAAALALEQNPQVTEAFVKHGYDMIGHGYRWMPTYQLTEEEERKNIRRARESIEKTTGQRIIGWITRPPYNLATLRILSEEGLLYDSSVWNDDLPYFRQVGDKRMLLVPYPLDQNDSRFWKNQLFTADHFFEYMRDAFDTLYEEGETHPKMMSLGIHCRICGRPARAQGLDRFLAHVRKFSKVWVTQRNEIARFWLGKYS